MDVDALKSFLVCLSVCLFVLLLWTIITHHTHTHTSLYFIHLTFYSIRSSASHKSLLPKRSSKRNNAAVVVDATTTTRSVIQIRLMSSTTTAAAVTARTTHRHVPPSLQTLPEAAAVTNDSTWQPTVPPTSNTTATKTAVVLQIVVFLWPNRPST